LNFLKVIFGWLIPDDKIYDYDDENEDYYLSKPSQDLTGDSLDGGDIYDEPDYVINY
jgi:hypothetical protein